MPESSLALAQAQIRRVTAFLRLSGNAPDASCADMLEQGLASMGNGSSAKEVLRSIGALCHPKALGDRFIPGITIFEWQAEIDLLEGRCAEAFQELEQSGSPPS